MSNQKVNQLTEAKNYDVSNMIFSEPIVGKVPDSKLIYRRINISTNNLNSAGKPDGTVGDLILPTSELFSFGVGENKSLETNTVNGHSLSLCMYSRDGASECEKDFVTTFNKIVNHCKHHLVTNRDEIEQYELSMEDLKKFNPLYYKKEKGIIVQNSGPTLYAKLMESKAGSSGQGKIYSKFYDENGADLDPLTLKERYCRASCAIKIDSIYIGSKISLQVKIYEANIERLESTLKPLLKNRLIEDQNRLIEDQNRLIEDQNRLISEKPVKVRSPPQRTKKIPKKFPLKVVLPEPIEVN